jgi:uncharacterized protein (TIGR02001 family)
LTENEGTITMITRTGTVAKSIAGAMALAFLAGPAAAGGLKDDPMPEGRMLAWSASFALTNDYVFRGFTQNSGKAAVQGTVEATYGMLYANAFASNVDFGNPPDANYELTFAAGVRPTLGPISFDLGVIYYTYPRANDGSGELNFFEVKAGASVSPWKDGTVGATVFYSPEYTGEIGEVWTFEGTVSQAFMQRGPFTPTFSAAVGYVSGEFNSFDGDDNYLYWNAGVTLAFHERFSLDLRYWDTNMSDGFCKTSGDLNGCDGRFSATAKVTF